MLKKFPWKTVLITILAWTLFWEIKDTMAGDKTLFLERWFFSDIKHANRIKVLPYLLTNEQVIQMLNHPDDEIEQPSNDKLYMKDVYLVLRIHNTSGEIAWGNLSWKMPDIHWNSLDINEIGVGGKHKKYSDTIIPVGIIIPAKTIPLPPVTVKWNSLYVY